MAKKQLIYVFDIDNTICKTKGAYYENVTPYKNRIKIINKLYDKGHKIIIYTARGSTLAHEWKIRKLTEEQLKKWGLKYHELLFGKPFYNKWIDDKGVNSNVFFKK